MDNLSMYIHLKLNKYLNDDEQDHFIRDNFIELREFSINFKILM